MRGTRPKQCLVPFVSRIFNVQFPKQMTAYPLRQFGCEDGGRRYWALSLSHVTEHDSNRQAGGTGNRHRTCRASPLQGHVSTEAYRFPVLIDTKSGQTTRTKIAAANDLGKRQEDHKAFAIVTKVLDFVWHVHVDMKVYPAGRRSFHRRYLWAVD